MGAYVASELIKKMNKKKIHIKNSKILIMGLTFKEDCADIRNSGVKSVIDKLKNYHCHLDLYDPWVDNEEAKKLFDISPIKVLKNNTYDGIILAVKHKKFKDMGYDKILNLCKKNYIIYDLKFLFSEDKATLNL